MLNSIKIGHIELNDVGTQGVIRLKDNLKLINEVSFIVLNLFDVVGKTVSHNVYWLSPKNNLSGFNNLDSTKVETKLVKTELGNTENKWTLQLTNNSEIIAFFIRPQLIKNGEEVMPSYWTSNYFTLAPHESITVAVSAPIDKLGGVTPTILVEGWNITKQVIKPSK